MMTRFSMSDEILLELAPFPLLLLLLACVMVVCLVGGGARERRVEFLGLQRTKLDWLEIGEEFNRHDVLQQRVFLCEILACVCATPIRFWNENA